VTRRAWPPLLALLLPWLAALLAGCATPPREAAGAGWTSGRLSVRMDATAEHGAQSMSAAFELRGDERSGELHLSSPLGTRLVTARWAPGLALLDNGDGEDTFDDLDALSRRALGENLPLAALPDWLRGNAWPGAPHVATTKGFEQLGWQVDLARRAEGWIEARRAAPPAVLMRVKLDGMP
jgi:outer membrane lipoprotein LolB